MTETVKEWAQRIYRENPQPQFPNLLEDSNKGFDYWEPDEPSEEEL